MENNNQSTLNKILLISVILLSCFLIAAIGFYFYTAIENKEITAPDPDLIMLGKAATQAQNLDMNGASAVYAELAATENDPIKRARYKILQGFASNNAGNYEVGIPLLKSVVADSEVSNNVKAEALAALLQVNFSPASETPLRMIFDDGGIYSTAMEGRDLNNILDLKLAVNDLYKVADSYHQYAISQYARAFSAAQYILSDTDIPASEKEEGLSFIKSMLKNGDDLMAAELQAGLYKDDVSNVVRDLLFVSMHMKLFALEVLAREDESVRAEVDTYYLNLLSTFSSVINAPVVQSLESYARFYYAAYLADVYGEEREGDIRNVMAPIYIVSGERATSNSYSIWPFFETTLADSESGNVNIALILEVADIDSNFQNFLETKGWLTAE